MALQSEVGKIYALFHACLPDDENVSYTLNLQKITSSKDYRMLAATKSGSKLVSTGPYSKMELSKCTAAELDEIIKFLPLALRFMNSLEQVLEFGDTALLTEAMKPDFKSSKSLINSITEVERIQKASDKNAANYTNIQKADVLALFDPQTVRTVDNLMETETQQTISTLQQSLPRVFSGKKYCINSSHIVALQKNTADEINKINSVRARATAQKSELRRYKLAATGVYALSLIGVMASSWDILQGGFFALIPGVALLILWLKG